MADARSLTSEPHLCLPPKHQRLYWPAIRVIHHTVRYDYLSGDPSSEPLQFRYVGPSPSGESK